MTSPKLLQGIELLDCAQANAKSGLSIAAHQCGYGDDIEAFSKNLQKAAREKGIHISNLKDLILEIPQIEREKVFSPDTPGRI